MPQKKAAQKKIQQDKKRQLQNKGIKSELKTIAKKLDEVISQGDAKKIEGMLRLFSSKLDKACKKGLIAKNTASRRKSRAAKRANKKSVA